jgi:beta-glucosidase/6-phospho-beta-glucosidase/beta-galactosidase
MTERAAVEGVPVRGCFLWSLLGKFEWADGYATQKRTPQAHRRFPSRSDFAQ